MLLMLPGLMAPFLIPMGVIISWRCLKNRKSVIAAIGFDFIINISQELLDITQTTKCIQTVVLFGIAATIVLMEKEAVFANGKSASNDKGLDHFKALPISL